MRNTLSRAAGVCALTAISLATSAPPAMAASFDGPWTVQIVTERGGCDSYGYSVAIRNGRIALREDAPVTLDGRVSATGVVQVNVRRGDQRADGRGRLSGNNGAGTWTGRSATAQCSGRWIAERQ